MPLKAGENNQIKKLVFHNINDDALFFIPLFVYV